MPRQRCQPSTGTEVSSISRDRTTRLNGVAYKPSLRVQAARSARRARVPAPRRADAPVSAPLRPGARRPAARQRQNGRDWVRCGWGGRLRSFTHLPGQGPASSKARGPIGRIHRAGLRPARSAEQAYGPLPMPDPSPGRPPAKPATPPSCAPGLLVRVCAADLSPEWKPSNPLRVDCSAGRQQGR
jgi:hypothetical protein